MSRLILSCFAAVLVSSSPCIAQGTFQFIHITFDGPPPQPPGTSYFIQEYHEAGMWFRPMGSPGPGNGFGRTGGGIAFLPENGTAYLQALMGDSLMFSFIDGTLFDLISVDLAEYSTVVPDAVTVPFVGYRSDGTVVTTQFTTDGIMDGTGPLADFETFYFDDRFRGLTRVEIPTWGWSLDNLVVAIPEPSSFVLFAFGASFLSARLLRRRRQ